ncbi:unnamed protein product [Trifolium pratense]|uniref:Uncharacterized protein n=1 Tax=Trifolium pratense TaxID=57577 RepID=A0ACB0KQY1_TRIPR|nr:unnamed protein product [Trifolium pratense]
MNSDQEEEEEDEQRDDDDDDDEQCDEQCGDQFAFPLLFSIWIQIQPEPIKMIPAAIMAEVMDEYMVLLSRVVK